MCGAGGAPVSLHLMILRMSSLFVRTLREDPADAEVPSHRLLVRAGYIRRVAPGMYTWLPLGLRVLRNIEKIEHRIKRRHATLTVRSLGGRKHVFHELRPHTAATIERHVLDRPSR